MAAKCDAEILKKPKNVIDNDEIDDEDDQILSQALPVADLKDETDLNVPPSTGEEYLYRVRLVF
jgi:hypothetical protein